MMFRYMILTGYYFVYTLFYNSVLVIQFVLYINFGNLIITHHLKCFTHTHSLCHNPYFLANDFVKKIYFCVLTGYGHKPICRREQMLMLMFSDTEDLLYKGYTVCAIHIQSVMFLLSIKISLCHPCFFVQSGGRWGTEELLVVAFACPFPIIIVKFWLYL